MAEKYRLLTEQEIVHFLSLNQDLPFWVLIRDAFRKFWGPTARYVSAEVNGEYDDEGGTDWSLVPNSISVQDAERRPVAMLSPLEWSEDTLATIRGLRYGGYQKDTRESILANLDIDEEPGTAAYLEALEEQLLDYDSCVIDVIREIELPDNVRDFHDVDLEDINVNQKHELYLKVS